MFWIICKTSSPGRNRFDCRKKQDSGHFFSLGLDQLPESRDAMDGQSMVTKKERDFFAVAREKKKHGQRKAFRH